MPASWFSYDDVAGRYASAAEPVYFAKPAEDLISFLSSAAGMRLLDVGTGSGAIAAAAIRLKPQTIVVACDESIPMLIVARNRMRGLRCVAADVTDLPFADGAYDAVTLGFVLSHLDRPAEALREIKRVLTAGGKVAVSSWSSSASASAAGDLWRSISEQYIPAAELEQAVATVVPSESLLAAAADLHATLSDAGFAAVSVHQREYPVTMRTDQFIETRMLAAPSRYMQKRLSPEDWNEFVSTVSRQLLDQFGSELRFHIAANFAIGQRIGV